MTTNQIGGILITLVLWSCSGQNKTSDRNISITDIPGESSILPQSEINALDSVNIDFQFRGNCYAYSSDKNAQPSNGEAHSGNLPKPVDKSFSKRGFYLVINEKEVAKIADSLLGCRLYLINTTDSLIELKASDSRLYIVAEVLNEKNEWAPISYLPSSWCGNSYHNVILDKNEYWSFDIPVFKGTYKTKLRYTLNLDDRKLFSNEIVTYVNKGQFNQEKKQGHTGNNVMDPYID